MRHYMGLAALIAFLALPSLHVNAQIETSVSSNIIMDAQFISGNTTSSDRFEQILGNNGGSNFRNGLLVFDPTPYLALAQDANATLISAELVLTERDARDANNGTQSGAVYGFFSAPENAGYVVNGPDAGNNGGNSANGLFGNSGGRPGRFGGGLGDANNADNDIYPLTDSNQLGVGEFGFGDITFQTGVTDTVTIDLLAGATDVAAVQATLANDDTSNAGIFITAPDFGSQIFFNSNGNNTGLLGESGAGDGVGPVLNLVFSQVPEPSSIVILGFAGLGAFVRRRR